MMEHGVKIREWSDVVFVNWLCMYPLGHVREILAVHQHT
jgi:hypothetical protein